MLGMELGRMRTRLSSGPMTVSGLGLSTLLPVSLSLVPSTMASGKYLYKSPNLTVCSHAPTSACTEAEDSEGTILTFQAKQSLKLCHQQLCMRCCRVAGAH